MNDEVDPAFKINYCFSEQATQTGAEMKDPVNESVDSITTPLFFNNFSEIEAMYSNTSKPQSYEICVALHEVRLLQSMEGDFLVNIAIGDKKKSTVIKESRERTIISEVFTFDFNTIPALFFSKLLTISFSRPKKLMRADKVAGQFNIDLGTLFDQPEHRFHHKWAPIFDSEHDLKGYVKCDLLITIPNMVLTTPQIEADEDNIEDNLLIPLAAKAERRKVQYAVNIYRAENLPSFSRSSVLKSSKSNRVGVNAYVSVSFDGMTGTTSVCSSSLNPVWNEKISFCGIYPPLCQRIKIEVCNESNNKQVLATHYLDLHQLYSNELQLLPTFGPSYIYLYATPKSVGYFDANEGILYSGRLLMSLETEPYVETEEESTSHSRVTVSEALPISPSTQAKDDEFLFFLTVHESNLINRKYVGKRINYELSIANMDELSSESMFEGSIGDSVSMTQRSLVGKETWSIPEGIEEELTRSEKSKTLRSISSISTVMSTRDRNLNEDKADRSPPIKAVACDKQYGYLPLGDTKPCLYSKRSFPDLRRRLYHSNVLWKIATELQIGLADSEFLIFMNRSEVCRRLRGVIQELTVGCNRFSAMALSSRAIGRNQLDINRCKHREKVLESISEEAITLYEKLNPDNVSDVIRTAYQWLNKLKNLSIDPQDAFPDIFIWMKVENKNVAYAKLKAKDYIFSLIDEDKGRFCGRYHNLLLRSPKSHKSVYNRLNIYAWFGPVKYKFHYAAGLLGGFDQCDAIDSADVIEVAPPRSLKYSSQEKCQLRAHIYHAVFNSVSGGLLNPFVKVIFDNHSLTTQTIEETTGPMWDVTLVLPEVTLYGDKESLKKYPPIVQLEVYDKDLKTNNFKFIGRCEVQCLVRFAVDEYSAPELQWKLIGSDTDCVAEILVAIEMIQLNENDDSMEYPAALPERIDNSTKAPFEMYRIPPAIRPEMSKYKLEVLFWGLRELKKIQFLDIEKPRIDVELAGQVVYSDELINFKENPNFSNPLKSIDVDLPTKCMPPGLTIRLVHKQFGQLTLAGSHVIPFIHSLIYKEQPQEVEETVEIGIDPRKYLTQKVQNGDLEKSSTEENEERQIDWWMRYRASLEDAVEEATLTENGTNEEPEHKEPQIEENLLIKLFDTELERTDEFGKLSDWGLRSFPLYRTKKKSTVDTDESEIIGVFKGSIQLYKDSIPNESIIENQEAIEPVSVLVRVYIVEAQNLVGKTSSQRINPYITFVLGGKKASDKDNYFENQQNPKIGKCFEFEATFPQDSLLTVQVHGYDRYGTDYLIGETKIDLENRYYSRHRLLCGLPQLYETEGVNKWRDSSTPSEILEKICNDLKLFGPEYWDDSIKVGKYSFVFTSDAENPRPNPLEKEQMSLAVLNNWKQAFGYSLMPEHVETRSLYNNRKPGLQQGSLHMWVDMYPRDAKVIPPPLDIAPQRLHCFELRVTIRRVADVLLKDVTFFTGERTGALYFKGWFVGMSDTQITDVQRTYTGDTIINWRFIFPFDYNPKQQQIVECQTSGQTYKPLMKCKNPDLNIELWDSRTLSNDKLLCSLTLPLNKLSNIAKSPRQCNLPVQSDSNNNSVLSLFKEKSIEGWFPLVNEKQGEISLRGKVMLSLDLLTKEEALESPVGFGRSAPKPLPKPKKNSMRMTTTVRRLKEKKDETEIEADNKAEEA